MKVNLPAMVEFNVLGVEIGIPREDIEDADIIGIPRVEYVVFFVNSDGTIKDCPEYFANENLYIKVVDRGRYTLHLERNNSVALEIFDDYVPSFIPNDYGDYINLHIHGGKIVNWADYFTEYKICRYLKENRREH